MWDWFRFRLTDKAEGCVSITSNLGSKELHPLASVINKKYDPAGTSKIIESFNIFTGGTGVARLLSEYHW